MRALVRELLYAAPTLDEHIVQLSTAFETAPPRSDLEQLAGRTRRWTDRHPQPRRKALLGQLLEDDLFRTLVHRHRLIHVSQVSKPRMHPLRGAEQLPQLETVRVLADWLRLDPEHLFWFADVSDRNRREQDLRLQHYSFQVRAKSDGSFRIVEAPKARLKAIQRQVQHDMLASMDLHPAVHGFRQGRSIVTFAAPHAGKAAVLRLDLENFFPSISGPRVQALFRTLGYPEPVADLLGGLCTTTTPRRFWAQTAPPLDPDARKYLEMIYGRPHLPQGAPSSPTIANLCAFRLDRRLAELAQAAGAAYTRYADDLAFSGDLSFVHGAEAFARRVAAIAREEGFQVQHRKTRLMRASVRQHLAGLTVNRYPNLSRRELDLLEATLTNSVRFGPRTQNREGHPDFRRHLEGRVAFVAMVNPSRAPRLRALLQRIAWDELEAG